MSFASFLLASVSFVPTMAADPCEPVFGARQQYETRALPIPATMVPTLELAADILELRQIYDNLSLTERQRHAELGSVLNRIIRAAQTTPDELRDTAAALSTEEIDPVVAAKAYHILQDGLAVDPSQTLGQLAHRLAGTVPTSAPAEPEPAPLLPPPCYPPACQYQRCPPIYHNQCYSRVVQGQYYSPLFHGSYWIPVSGPCCVPW
jgi:hypothetical protein